LRDRTAIEIKKRWRNLLVNAADASFAETNAGPMQTGSLPAASASSSVDVAVLVTEIGYAGK
jgi:hypothetical protein